MSYMSNLSTLPPPDSLGASHPMTITANRNTVPTFQQPYQQQQRQYPQQQQQQHKSNSAVLSTILSNQYSQDDLLGTWPSPELLEAQESQEGSPTNTGSPDGAAAAQGKVRLAATSTTSPVMSTEPNGRYPKTRGAGLLM
jgi:hypothetical protein